MSTCRLFVLLIATTFILTDMANCGPARAYALTATGRATKIPRSIRAPFRNTEMMTARGFGKRSSNIKYREASGLSWPIGKYESNYVDDILTSDSDPLDQIFQQSQSSYENFPIDWFANELATNPQLARALLHRFVDTDKDGYLSAHELIGGGTPFNGVDTNFIY